MLYFSNLERNYSSFQKYLLYLFEFVSSRASQYTMFRYSRTTRYLLFIIKNNKLWLIKLWYKCAIVFTQHVQEYLNKFIFVKVNASNWGKESMILEVLFLFLFFYLQWEKIKQTFNKVLKIRRLADSLNRYISNI